MLKRLAAHLPARWQFHLRLAKYRWQIHAREFRSPEPEFDRLAEWVKPGDWVIDVGANIGHYTNRLSELVGPQGRVIAFEPVPETFEILKALMWGRDNVLMVNCAVSDNEGRVSFTVPTVDGSPNFYEAYVTAEQWVSIASVPCTTLDRFCGLHEALGKISFVKIDAEGHEGSVIAGMRCVLEQSRPIILMEAWKDSPGLAALKRLGYGATKQHEDAPNYICRPWRESV